MSIEMAQEAMEIITMSVDKHQATKNYEVDDYNSFSCTKLIYDYIFIHLKSTGCCSNY